MRQLSLIKATTPEEFEIAYNEACAELSRCKIVGQDLIDMTTMYLYYEEDETIPTPEAEKKEKRWCAECGAYRWGKKCLYGKQRIRPMTEACEHFTAEIMEEEKSWEQ